MKRILKSSLLFALAACSLLPAFAQSEKPEGNAPKTVTQAWEKIPVPQLHEFHPQEPRRIELPNGLVIFLQEDHELPLIDAVIRIRGGRRDEPAGKTGLTTIYAESWRTGGTQSKTGDDLDDFLETRAALVEPSASNDYTSLSWSSLKGDFDSVFAMVLDLLEHPEFRQNKIDLAKEQMASVISRRNDDVNSIAQRESTKLGYGPDNPYARTSEYHTVAAVTREDLLNWHKRTVLPNNMMLGMAGDFDSAAMERKLREAFGSLAKGAPVPKQAIPFKKPTPGIYFIEKEDVNQSEITMVDLGIERRNPDYYAVEVMNELFGGSSSSRLSTNIRTKLGLAYSVGGGIGTGFDHPGLIRIGMGTKSGSTAAALDALNKEVTSLIQGNVTEEELKKAKDAILNSFIFSVDSKDKVLAERMSYEFYGYPPDSLERYRAGIEKVTVADVNRVAKKYVHPDKLAILVVGNSKDFDRKLSSFGKVTAVDIAIPQAAGKAGD
ncbi:MAG TPA: pitrilysin family protein [Candidatus Angelobacter sp.]|nr:pitrilysin family protein [Candidatus Angelobacter sp.]